ncbi:MAG: zf-TFIIB domain-containing protein [Dehalococcoidia bacterium]|nr:zf-TFIIB domain-containing protein [Dehalococcoidia bacterium]
MDCPACKGVMVVVEHERIELDYCTECFGGWFDAGELELLLERLALDGSAFTMDEIMALPDKKVTEKARPCPICRKKMRKVVIGSQPEVLIDICARGHGLWFDGGELNDVIRQLADTDSGTSDKQGRVISFLGEAFKARE